MWNIYEHWWTAILIAAIVQLALTIIHVIKPDTRKLWHVLIPIAIIVIGIGVERLVQTDFEKINILIGNCLAATTHEDLAEINSLLAPDYSDSCHTSKDIAMADARRWFGRPLIKSNQKYPGGTQIEIHRPAAEVNLIVVIRLDPKSEYSDMAQYPLLVKAKLYLKRNDDGKWLIQRAELLEINNQPVRWNQI